MGSPVSAERASHSPSGPQCPGPQDTGDTINWAPLSLKTCATSFLYASAQIRIPVFIPSHSMGSIFQPLVDHDSAPPRAFTLRCLPMISPSEFITNTVLYILSVAGSRSGWDRKTVSPCCLTSLRNSFIQGSGWGKIQSVPIDFMNRYPGMHNSGVTTHCAPCTAAVLTPRSTNLRLWSTLLVTGAICRNEIRSFFIAIRIIALRGESIIRY